MRDEKRPNEANRHAQRVECTLSRVDRSESRPGSFFLHLEGTQYVHDVRQTHSWDWDIEFDQTRLVHFAQDILKAVDPVSNERLLERMRELVRKE